MAMSASRKDEARPSCPAAPIRSGAFPAWNGPVAIETLKGGLSNESFLVSDGNGRHVVRFGRDFPFHQVYREREIMSARAAAAAGLGPAVEYAEPGVMVCAFLDARTYDGEDVRANRIRIAHVDGGHDYGVVRRDIEVVARLLRDEGVIAFDDFFNRRCPGTTQAIIEFLLHSRQFAPFMLTTKKLWVCRREWHDAYSSHFAAGDTPYGRATLLDGKVLLDPAIR